MSSESIFEIVMSAWLECSFRWALATLVAREANGNVGLSSVKAYLFLLVAVLHRPNYVTLRLCCAVEQRAQTFGKTAYSPLTCSAEHRLLYTLYAPH